MPERDSTDGLNIDWQDIRQLEDLLYMNKILKCRLQVLRNRITGNKWNIFFLRDLPMLVLNLFKKIYKILKISFSESHSKLSGTNIASASSIEDNI
jgi:hypothetical protein